jgi:hypothetical protein
MRDWLLVLIPLATAIYLFLRPDQLAALVRWVEWVIG